MAGNEKRFNLERVEEIQRKALEKNWSYPYLFNSLKSIGVERYEVDVASRVTRFFGEGTSFVQPGPADAAPLTPSKSFDGEAVKRAIARSQAKEIDFQGFLAEIAAAGVVFYRVDMRPRAITYHGQKPYKHVEPVPDTTENA